MRGRNKFKFEGKKKKKKKKKKLTQQCCKNVNIRLPEEFSYATFSGPVFLFFFLFFFNLTCFLLPYYFPPSSFSHFVASPLFFFPPFSFAFFIILNRKGHGINPPSAILVLLLLYLPPRNYVITLPKW